MVKKVLINQPLEHIQKTTGEYYKILFLMPPRYLKNAPTLQKLTAKELWRDLPAIVDAKWKIVLKDPYETKKSRVLLNLGHTVGHVLEGALKLPHGKAVHLGLLFSLRWNRREKDFASILPSQDELAAALKQVKQPEKWLRRDKKLSGKEKIQFLFVQAPGKAQVKEVGIQQLVQEWKRQAQ